jgi:uncharacterized membrane protein HdeD (DUF308 family)
MNATSAMALARRSVNWSIGLSILMIVAGILAILMPPVAGLAVNLVVAWLLIFSALAHLVFAWHTRTAGGFVWEILVGLLYGFVGVYLLMHPVAGLVTLTLALAIYLFLEAVFEFALWFFLRLRAGAGWLLFDGVVTLILAILIWKTWPSSTEWAIGTLVGISMLFSGTTRLMLSLAARKVATEIA